MLFEIKKEFALVTCPAELANAVSQILADEHPFDREKEQIFAIGLNVKHSVRYIDMVSMGVLDSALIHPREAFRHAVAYGAAAIAFAHNHPSGDVSPSSHDLAMTRQMIIAGKFLGIEVLDHIIVGVGSLDFMSLRESQPDLGWNESRGLCLS